MASIPSTQCGATEKLEVDHIQPFSKGGKTIRQNLQCLCETCNTQNAPADIAALVAAVEELTVERDEWKKAAQANHAELETWYDAARAVGVPQWDGGKWSYSNSREWAGRVFVAIDHLRDRVKTIREALEGCRADILSWCADRRADDGWVVPGFIADALEHADAALAATAPNKDGDR